MNEINKKILITGGAGYIGSHAVYAFLDAGYSVIVVDNLSTGIRKNLPSNLTFYQGDVGDSIFIDEILAQHQPRGILHFAGSIVVPESISDPYKYYWNNTVASLSLMNACLKNKVKRFLFSSSAAVYGIPADGIAFETSPTQPINPYGWSKLMTEQIIKDIANAHDLTFAILRYFNVAGADPKGHTGQSTPQATHLIKIACEVATGKRDYMTIFGTDYATKDGTCIRDFIHVDDLANAHLKIFEYIDTTNKNVCLNCGNGHGYSVLEVINTLEEILGRKISTEKGPRREGDPSILVANADLLREKINWHSKHDLQTMITSALQWEEKNSRRT